MIRIFFVRFLREGGHDPCCPLSLRQRLVIVLSCKHLLPAVVSVADRAAVRRNALLQLHSFESVRAARC